MNLSFLTLLFAFIKILIMVGFLFNVGALLTWVDRRQSAMIQDRIGPNRAVIKIPFLNIELRAFGLIHTAADGLKFFFKEDFIPPNADKLLFGLAPILAMAPVLALIAVIPFGDIIDLRSGVRLRRQGRPTPSPTRFASASTPRTARRRHRRRHLSSRASRGSAAPASADRAHRRPSQRRNPLSVRAGGAGDRRRGHRRLEQRQQVLADGGAPRLQPDGQLRGDHRPVPRRGHDAVRLRPPRRHGALAGRERVGHLRPAGRVLPLLRMRGRRDEAHPLRLAGGRERARVRVLHRVLRDEVRHVLLRRVHGSRDELDAHRDHLPRWLAAPVPPPRRHHDRVRRRRRSSTWSDPARLGDAPPGADLLRQGARPLLLPGVRPLEPPALPLRPAHEDRLARPPAAVAREHLRHRLPHPRHRAGGRRAVGGPQGRGRRHAGARCRGAHHRGRRHRGRLRDGRSRRTKSTWIVGSSARARKLRGRHRSQLRCRPEHRSDP